MNFLQESTFHLNAEASWKMGINIFDSLLFQ